MPPSGWYEDPDQAWTWRYWDGVTWTEHRAPMWVPPARDPQSFSVWFERSVVSVRIAVRRVGVLLVSVWSVLGALGWWLAVASFDDERGRELRRILDIDHTTIAPMGSAATAELTAAEAERAWKLLQEIFWSALPWLIVLVVVAAVASAWSVALVARAARLDVADGPEASNPPADGLRRVAAGALGRVPAVLASGFVVSTVFAGVWIAAALPVVVVVVAGGGGAAIVLTVVFVVLLVLVATGWLWGRLTLASVIAASAGHGLGVGRSWALTHGQFWFVAGRLLVAGLIAGAVSSVANVVNWFGQFFGLAAYLAVVLLVQSLAFAAAIVITVCGHLTTIDQIDEVDEVAR